MSADPRPGSWTHKFYDLIRALTGALLFGIPLIYTMEMWWIAVFLDLWKLLLFVLLGLGINFYLARLVALREGATVGEALAEAIENMAVGIVASAVTLLVLDRIDWGGPLDRTLAGILLQSIPLSVGAAVTHTTRRKRDDLAGGHPLSGWASLFDQIGVTLAGALFFSFAIAPVEEIPTLEAQLDLWHLFGLIGFSLLLTYIIVYRSGLAPRWGNTEEGRSLLSPLVDTLMTYALSLLIAGLTLYLFDQIEVGNPLIHSLSLVVVLGLPATVGGAAGRHIL